ncbi:Copper homeostasis protein cutC [Treponema brennaborense DSM 12168]|uniref:PF03932 family protein CutC n=2 Tax=Treponema TaxID=157 RepID=F4LNX4_TREBD|nr:Copper homeostasis protein cutC [Treponema brennaborense DSM 12168]
MCLYGKNLYGEKMNDYILEVCVDSVESALAATEGGATRLELCSALIVGGVTPSACLFEAVRGATRLPVRVLIRPRFGDFCYSVHEFEIIRNEVALYRKLGADGVVIGCLQPDGALDTPRLRILKETAGALPITLHRAFDMCRNPFETLEQAERLGIDTVLTSGQKQNCTQGSALLADLNKRFGSDITIMAGGGVSADGIRKLYETTGITAFHLSGKTTVKSAMTYRNPAVRMGLESISEYGILLTDMRRIRAAADVLRGL